MERSLYNCGGNPRQEDEQAPAQVTDVDVRHLHWLRREVSDVVDLLVITTGTTAYRRADGVAVVPLALLGA
jgi:hypothetical protein